MKELLLGDSIFSNFLQVIPISIFITIVYTIARIIYIKKSEKNYTKQHEILLAIFICYLAGLINLVLVPQNFWLMVWYKIIIGYNGVEIGNLFQFEFNLIPSLFNVVTGNLTLGGWVIKMLIFNVLMFVPMGIFIKLLFYNDKKIKTWKLVLIPLIIEILQLFVGRSFDVDDIICNFLGIIIGVYVTSIVKKKWSRNEKICR